MDDTPCHIHVSIFTKCGNSSVTRTTPAHLGGLHATAQEVLGRAVKDFRKKLTTDITDAEPVSVGSLRLHSDEFGLPISDIDYVDAQLAHLKTRIADLEAILKANDICMREAARPRVLQNLRDTMK